MYLSYDVQSSHPGYIDMEFKEIVHKAPSEHSLPIGSGDLFDAVVDGYYYEGFVPAYMSKVFDCEGDYKSARVSKRLIKGWCDRVAESI